jgi:hypothetical protein
MAMLLPWGWAMSLVAARATNESIATQEDPVPFLVAQSPHIVCFLAVAMAMLLLWAGLAGADAGPELRTNAKGQWLETPPWVFDAVVADSDDKAKAKARAAATPADNPDD